MKRFFFLLILLLWVLPAAAERNVVVTNFPIYDFASHVAGDAAQVRMLISPGTEVHAYDPTPKDMIAVQECDAFLYIGGESDEWVETLLDSLSEPPSVLKLMDCVDVLEEGEEEAHEHAHADEIEYDEHIWTSPVNAMRMVQAIADSFSAQDSANAELYQRNAAAYIAQIAETDARFRQIASEAKRSKLIFADRFPLAYFTHEYGLEAVAAFNGCSSETEPSAKVMRKLIDAVRVEDIPCVYTIEMSAGRVAQTMQEETGCEILQLHSCQNVTKSEMEAGETYVSLMRKNADALRRGLE